MSGQKKVAIVYDWIDKWGGVERVLLQLHEIFPQAVFYTSYFDAEKAPWAQNLKIKTSFIQRLPDFIKKIESFHYSSIHLHSSRLTFLSMKRLYR